jgi:hypothetical protein
MGSISITFTDNENGVNATSYVIPEKDMKRIYKVLKETFEEEKVDVENEDGVIESRTMEYTPYDVYKRLAIGILDEVCRSVIDNERLLLYRTMGIKPIEFNCK